MLRCLQRIEEAKSNAKKNRLGRDGHRSMQHFAPVEAIPSAVYLTSYTGGTKHFMRTPLQQLAQEIPAGTLKVQIGRAFHLEAPLG